MKPPEYRKGAEVRKDFESTMTKLFRIPKSELAKQKPEPPSKKAPVKKEN